MSEQLDDTPRGKEPLIARKSELSTTVLRPQCFRRPSATAYGPVVVFERHRSPKTSTVELCVDPAAPCSTLMHSGSLFDALTAVQLYARSRKAALHGCLLPARSHINTGCSATTRSESYKRWRAGARLKAHSKS